MDRIESASRVISADLEPLSYSGIAQAPTACTWAIALVGAGGGGVGFVVGWVNCHNHGCIHQAKDSELPADVSEMSVGDLLSVRNGVAAAN